MIFNLDPDDVKTCENNGTTCKSEYTIFPIDEMTKIDGLYICNDCNLDQASDRINALEQLKRQTVMDDSFNSMNCFDVRQIYKQGE